MKKDFVKISSSSSGSWSTYIPKQTVMNPEMIPYIKKHKQHDVTGNRKEPTLQLFTGQRRPGNDQKIEQGTLFNMEESKIADRIGNTGKAANQVNFTNIDRDRFFTAIKYRDDVFEKTNVGPGLNIDKQVDAADGFHSKFRFTDEMENRNYQMIRTLTDQLPDRKISDLTIKKQTHAKDPAELTKVRGTPVFNVRDYDVSFPKQKSQVDFQDTNQSTSNVKNSTLNQDFNVTLPQRSFESLSYEFTKKNDNKGIQFDRIVTHEPFLKESEIKESFTNVEKNHLKKHRSIETISDVEGLPGRRNLISYNSGATQEMNQSKKKSLIFDFFDQKEHLQKPDVLFDIDKQYEQTKKSVSLNFPIFENRNFNSRKQIDNTTEFSSRHKDVFTDIGNVLIQKQNVVFDPVQFGTINDIKNAKRSVPAFSISEMNRKDRNADDQMVPSFTSKNQQLFPNTDFYFNDTNKGFPVFRSNNVTETKRNESFVFPQSNTVKMDRLNYSTDVGLFSSMKKSFADIFDFVIGKKENVHTAPSKDAMYDFSKKKSFDFETFNMNNKKESSLFSNNEFKEIFHQNKKRSTKEFDVFDGSRISKSLLPDNNTNISSFMVNMTKKGLNQREHFPSGFVNIFQDDKIQKTASNSKKKIESNYTYLHSKNMHTTDSFVPQTRLNIRIDPPMVVMPKEIKTVPDKENAGILVH